METVVEAAVVAVVVEEEKNHRELLENAGRKTIRTQ